VEEINVEAEFHLVENRCRPDVADEQNRDGANQGRLGGIGARRLHDVATPCLERSPISITSLHRYDLLRECQRHGYLEDVDIGEMAIALQKAELLADRIVALAMPANQQLGLFPVGLDSRHRCAPADDFSGRAWPFRRRCRRTP
jgi:hypothetical protein